MQLILSKRLRRLTALYHTLIAKEIPGFDPELYGEIILILNDHKTPLTNKQLSEYLQVSKSRVTALLNYLARYQYIITQANATDKRKQLVSLTEKGKQLVPAIQNAINKVNAVLHEQLEQHKLVAFYMTLNQMEQNLSGQGEP